MPDNQTGQIVLIPTELALGTGRDNLSPRVLEAISKLDLFAVENIRTARRFISSLALDLNIESLEFVEVSKDTKYEEYIALINSIKSGRSVGVMSEAGCPGIADPGSALVGLAHRQGIGVVPLVGPSSFVLALMASGLNGQKFAFHGYLPIDKAERLKAIQELEKRSKKDQEAQIFMETPFRNDALLADVLNTCQRDTQLCIAADVTGPNEMIRTKRIENWKKDTPSLRKIPAVFILQSY